MLNNQPITIDECGPSSRRGSSEIDINVFDCPNELRIII